jgi:hypothetical protein
MSRRLLALFATLGLMLAPCLALAGCSRGPKVSQANADKITVGMSDKEVNELLGAPSESVVVMVSDIGALRKVDSKSSDEVRTPQKARQVIWRDGSKAITVTFYQGMVMAKAFADNSGIGKAEALDQPPFQQTGTFDAVPNEEGIVNFPIPYALAPNVEVSVPFMSVVVKDATATSFKWKGVGNAATPPGGSRATWTSRGVKATKLPERERQIAP